jgi:hypothetical protein
MIGDHHGRTAGRATLLVRAADAILGTHIVLGHHDAQVAFAEDQHPVGDLGPCGEHEPLRKGVRARTSGRDLHRRDARAGQDRIERIGELPGAVADQETDPVAELEQFALDPLAPPAVVFGGEPLEERDDLGADLGPSRPVRVSPLPGDPGGGATGARCRV